MTFDVSRLTFHVSRFLLLILLAALAVRVHRLAAQSLWYDEAVTAHVAGQGIAELTRWTADDIQPPLYYYAVAGWTALAGRSEWALRFPSVCFGVLTTALMWVVARRLFGLRAAAGLAALLTAFSPLYVYYAQEARMYTQLTFWGLLAGYALLRAMGWDGRERPQKGGRPRRGGWPSAPTRASAFAALFADGRRAVRWWLVFVMAAVAALYTHYFAAFLLLACALCVLVALIVQMTRSDRAAAWRRGIAAAAAGAAIVLLYLPWLPAMLTRYRLDRSYWQGALKLGEALRHVAISFTVAAPEMMLETDAVRLLPWFGLAFVAAMAGLIVGAQGRAPLHGRTSLLLLLACLLVPTVGILALASRTPKFNARYLMIASPAYLLTLAGGMGYWISGIRDWGLRISGRMFRGASTKRKPNTQSPIPNPQSPIPAILAAALVVFVMWTSFAALRNWFTDRAFAKAQWRELTAAVRAKMAPDETVVLVSGHAWPAWDYYAADIPAIRLPALDILDVEAVLGFEDGPRLGEALRGKRGVWLVRWQAETVDPVGFAPYFLDRIGVEQPQPRRFWHLDLRHWRLGESTAIPAGPTPAHADGANFAHKLALIGWDDPVGGQLTVYWRTLNRLTADYQVSLILSDAAGREVGRWDGRPAGYDYPTMRWRPGQMLFGRYPLPLRADAAGDYYVSLAVYDASDPAGLDIRDVADNPAGKRVRLGPLRLAGK